MHVKFAKVATYKQEVSKLTLIFVSIEPDNNKWA